MGFYGRLFFMLLGNLLLGVSIGLFRMVDLGTDPFSSMIIGLSQGTQLSFGTIQLIVCIFLFIAMILFKRESIGLGTLPSIFLNGYVSDFVYYSLVDTAFDTDNFLEKGVLFAFTLLICCLSVAICMEANHGTAAYDTLAIIVEEQTQGKISFKMARIYTDLFCLFIGVVFRAKIGINTVIMACFTGLFVQYFRKQIRLLPKKIKIPQSTQGT